MSGPSFNQIIPRSEHDDELTPEEIAEKRRKRRWIIVMLIIVVLGSIVAFNARALSRGIKGWQAERAARQSARFLAARDYKNAQAKVQDALALSPQNPAGIFAAARFLSTVGNHRDAISFWKQLEERGPLSAEDQRQYASALLASGDALQADNHLKLAWPATQPGTPDDWMIALNLALQRRAEARAIELAEKIMADQKSTPGQRLKAASLMTSAPQPAQRTAAWQRIETLSAAPDETGLEALITLARRAAAPGASKTATGSETFSPAAIASAIEANPQAQTRHFLFAMDLRLLREPLRKAEMIAAAEAKFSGSDDDLEALTAWLYGKGEYQKVLAHLPPEISAHRRSLFLQSLDARAALGQWKDVASAINAANFSLDKVTAEMYLARCSRELGEKSGADLHWQAALDAAQGNVQQLVLVADYAERAGNIPIAKAGFQAATEARNDFLPAFQRLLALAQAQGDTAALNELLKRMSIQWPAEAAVRNDLAYTDLLLEKNAAAATRTAEVLFAKEPGSLPHRITLSLARLRAGDAAGAVQPLDHLTGDLGTLEARKRAVQAAALWANDQKSAAQTEIRGLDLTPLFPEERALIRAIPRPEE